MAKSSVSVWVRDVDFVPKPRNRGHRSHRPHPLHLAKLAEIEQCRTEAIELITPVSDRDLLLFGLALYAGEGSKRDGELRFANSNAAFMGIYAAWLRTFFEIEESRLRVRLYLHEGLDLDAAVEHWSIVSRRRSCRTVLLAVSGGCGSDHSAQQARVRLRHTDLQLHPHSPACDGDDRGGIVIDRPSGVAQLAEHRTVNAIVVGSSPTPGAGSAMGPPVLGGPARVFGAVAQWSEQGTHNPWVVGSIPTRPTTSAPLLQPHPGLRTTREISLQTSGQLRRSADERSGRRDARAR